MALLLEEDVQSVGTEDRLLLESLKAHSTGELVALVVKYCSAL